MKNLQYIHKIIPYIDEAFSEFYDAMLSDKKLAIFFDSDEQIRKPIAMQKAHFLHSLSVCEDEFETIYVKLGEYHYDMRIPYVCQVQSKNTPLRNANMYQ